LKIQETTLTHHTLKNEIANFINKKKQEYPKFKNVGYVTVLLEYYNKNATQKEVSYIFSIKDQYISLKENSNYPLFFTFINNKIVLLYTNTAANNNKVKLSKRSKKRLAKKIKKSLGTTERLIVLNPRGKKIIDDNHFNPHESFNIHGGITLKIYTDNRIEIIKN
jgi:hypothetical protein